MKQAQEKQLRESFGALKSPNIQIKDQTTKHWFWDSWVLLAFGHAIFMCIRENLIGSEFSKLQLVGLLYLAPACFVVSLLYFIYRKEWARRNDIAHKDTDKIKVLTRTWDNRFDWWCVMVCALSSLIQVSVFISAIMAFMVSRRAGLNIGITTAIWSIVPFVVALIERIFFKVSIGLYQIVGMLLIVIMTILISLSDLFGPDAKEEKLNDPNGKTTPVYVAVLYAFIYPVVATAFTMTVKYIKMLKLSADDWLLGYNFVWALVVSIIAIIYF